MHRKTEFLNLPLLTTGEGRHQGRTIIQEEVQHLEEKDKEEKLWS